jgi:hypothetical protein
MISNFDNEDSNVETKYIEEQIYSQMLNSMQPRKNGKVKRIKKMNLKLPSLENMNNWMNKNEEISEKINDIPSGYYLEMKSHHEPASESIQSFLSLDI